MLSDGGLCLLEKRLGCGRKFVHREQSGCERISHEESERAQERRASWVVQLCEEGLVGGGFGGGGGGGSGGGGP